MIAHQWYIDGMTDRHPGLQLDGSERVFQSSMKSVTVDPDERRVYGVITTPRVDLEGEVILPDFDLSYFPKQHKSVFYCHQYDQFPVGKCVNMTVEPDGVFATTYITKGHIGNDILTMLREGVIGGFSIGTKRLDFGKPTPDEVRKHGACDIITRKSMMLEYSITPTPMNPDAVQIVQDMVAAKSIRASTAAIVFGGDVVTKGQKVDSATPIIIAEDGTPYAVRFG